MLYTEIKIAEKLDPQWTTWFEGMDIQAAAAGGTVLCGILTDQSSVYGIVSRIASLGLTLMTVTVRDQRDYKKDEE
jgi:hypothetical protein